MFSLCAVLSMIEVESSQGRLFYILQTVKLNLFKSKEKKKSFSHVFKSRYKLFESTCNSLPAQTNLSPSWLCVLTVRWSWESLAGCLWKMDH